MNRLMIYTVLICNILSYSSCEQKTEHLERKLEEIEQILYERPDSALMIIYETDITTTDLEHLRARYALLKTIALDRNCIDICSDSVIADAVTYYSRRGSDKEKAETYYYTARVFENADKPNLAMLWLVKAEKACESYQEQRLMALIYASKGRIYHQALYYEKAAYNYHLASLSCLSSGNNDKYLTNMLRKADCLIMNKEYESATNVIDTVLKYKNELSLKNLNRLYQAKINLKEHTAPNETDSLRSEYLNAITDPTLTDWVMIAGTYISSGDSSNALKALANQKKHRDENAAYFYRMGQALELKKDYVNAIEAYKKYDMLSGNIGRKILCGNIRFIEEKQEKIEQYENARMKNTILALAICAGIFALLTSFLFILIIRRKLASKEHENASLRKQFEDLMMERQELAKAEIRNNESIKIINERLRIIDQFVLSEALNDTFFEEKASETLNNIINDRKVFIKDTRLIFNASYPTFITYLTNRGLNEKEMEYCCLYAIGLNGKMAASFTNDKRHYHTGCEIRKKLSLGGHDTNLSIYIRNLLHELEYTGN